MNKTDIEALKSWLGCDTVESDITGVWVSGEMSGFFLSGPALHAFQQWQVEQGAKPVQPAA